jgi:signal peptidase I
MFLNITRKLYSFLIDIVQTVLIAAAIFLVIYTFLFRPFEVKGESMYPNFKDKEYVLTNLIALRLSSPKTGDVIVFKAPPDPEKDFIKRIIGVEGDMIALRDGNIYKNGKLLDESSYLKPSVKTYGGSFIKDNQPFQVPLSEYFVLGDNRFYSSDSREWGFVPKSSVIGESFFVYWPPEDLGFVKNPYSN